MGTFPITTSHAPLFGKNGDFFGEAQISATHGDKEFVVTVTGIRGYSKYSWNFGQRVELWLANNSSGTGKVSVTPTIPASGSNTYKGWIPSSGYYNVSLTKKFPMNSDGTCPTVWFYFRIYNPSIKNLGTGNYEYLDVSYSGNISSTVQSKAGGAFDVSPAQVSINSVSTTASTITFTASSTEACDIWQYSFESDKNYKTFKEDNNGTTTPGSYTIKGVKSEKHTLYVKARKKSNSVTSSPVSKTADCQPPTIQNPKLVPVSGTSGNLSFTCSHSCKWYLSGSTGNTSTWSTTATTSVARDVTLPEKDGDYTLHVQRSDNPSLTANVTLKCDTVLPSIENFTIVPESNTKAKVTVKFSHPCTWGIYDADRKKLMTERTVAASTEDTCSIAVQNIKATYQLYASRTSSALLKVIDTEELDMTLPSINATLRPVSDSQSLLTFTSSHLGSWRLDTIPVSKSLAEGQVNTAGANISTQVDITAGTSSNYRLYVMRRDYPVLFSTRDISSDNIPPVITIENITTTGNIVSFTASSSVPCINWTYSFTKSAGSTVSGNIITDNPTTSVSMTVYNLDPGVDYTLSVSAVKASTGVSGTSVGKSVNCQGLVSIFNEGKYFPVDTVYLYTDKKFVVATPYVYTQGKWGTLYENNSEEVEKENE